MLSRAVKTKALISFPGASSHKSLKFKRQMHLFTNMLQKHCFLLAQVFKKTIFVPKHFLKATSAWVVYSNIHVAINKETELCVHKGPKI